MELFNHELLVKIWSFIRTEYANNFNFDFTWITNDEWLLANL